MVCCGLVAVFWIGVFGSLRLWRGRWSTFYIDARRWCSLHVLPLLHELDSAASPCMQIWHSVMIVLYYILKHGDRNCELEVGSDWRRSQSTSPACCVFHPVTSRFASLHSSRLLDAEEEGNAKGKAADITHSEHKELGRRKNIEASLDVKTDNERAPNLHSCLHKLILIAHEINQAVFLGPQWLISSVMTVLCPTRKPRGALFDPGQSEIDSPRIYTTTTERRSWRKSAYFIAVWTNVGSSVTAFISVPSASQIQDKIRLYLNSHFQLWHTEIWGFSPLFPNLEVPNLRGREKIHLN